MGLFTDIYNTVAKFFRQQDEPVAGEASKAVATNRLKLVLMQDRTNLTPKVLEQMRGELVDLLSKYLEISFLSGKSPLLEVYWVYPFFTAEIPASLISHGVIKSGSPTPSDITSSISEAISKNFLIPDGLIFTTVGFKILS